MIVHFSGDPEALLERFERVREMWIEAQEGDYERPAFYAACRTDGGIAIISAWTSAVAHRAFGQGLHPHLDAVGLAPPDGLERMRIAKLGWD